MALFTDGPPADIEFLRQYDSAVLDVAGQEGIDLEAKLRLAAEEIGENLQTFIIRHRPLFNPVWSGLPNLQMALKAAVLRTVVVTASVQRWHAFHALELIYRDAYGNQLNDRYLDRWEEYTTLAAAAEAKLYSHGVSMVSMPVGAPAAPSIISNSNGSDKPIYYARATCVDQDGRESAPSPLTSGGIAQADQLIARACDSNIAAGWNIYLGTDADQLSLQNEAPMSLGDVWTFSGQVSLTGRDPGYGQRADYCLCDYGGLLRG